MLQSNRVGGHLKLVHLLLVPLIGISSMASAAGIQDSQCYPNTPEAQTWPICVIYLHGLFSPKDQYPVYKNLELSNRQTLKKLAKGIAGQHCRIAVPVSPTLYHSNKYGTNLVWSGHNLSFVKNAAKAACQGSAVKKPLLAKQLAIFGFSNGGNEAVQLAQGSCKDQIGISIFAFGPDGDHRRGHCGNLVTINKHELPKADILESDLAKIGTRSTTAANPAVISGSTVGSTR